MSAKNTYSIDDIMSEYSSDDTTEEPEEKRKIQLSVSAADSQKDVSANDDEKNNSSNVSTSSKESQAQKNTETSELPVISEQSEEKEDTNGIVSHIKSSFSYRSATRIEDKPNKILQNPENNIRYVNREKNSEKKSDSSKLQKVKEALDKEKKQKKAEKHISKAKKETKDFKSVISAAANNFSEFEKNIFRHRTVADKESGIAVKSTPEIDFFSIDVEINEGAKNEKRKIKHASAERNDDINVNKSNMDDYNAPGDETLILEDLYDLKSNLSIKLILQIIATVLSIYLSAVSMYSLPVPEAVDPSKAPHAYAFLMFTVSAIVMFTSFSVITNGWKSLFCRRADSDTLAAVSITFCTISAAISTENPALLQNGTIHIFTPVAIAVFLANTIGKNLIISRAINNFDQLINTSNTSALIYVSDENKAEQLTKGLIPDYPILAASKKTSFASDFLKYTYSSDIADKICKKMVPAVLIISVLLTLLTILLNINHEYALSPAFIFSIFSLYLSASICTGYPVVVNLPLSDAAANAEENESMILGYQGIDDFYDTNSVIISASEIFPAHSVKLCSIKMFSDIKIDDAIIAAASLVCSSGSIFTEMFSKIIDNNSKLLEKVENRSYEDFMGLCGWINNKRVLFGNRQHMVNHNIEGLPPKSKEKDIAGKGRIALYLSVSGNLAAIFIVKIKADKKISESIDRLITSKISIVVNNIDSAVTAEEISRLFKIPEETIKIVPAEFSDFCHKITAPAKITSSSVVCTSELSSLSKALASIKSVYSNIMTGIVVQSASAIIALCMVLTFLCLGILNEVTPLLLLFYHAILMLLSLLIVKVRPK